MLSSLFYFTFSVFAICANAAVPTPSGTRLPKLPALPFPHPNFPKEAPYPPPACLISCVTQNAYPDKCNGMQNYKCLCKTQAESIVACLLNICPKDTVFSIKANKNLPISSIAITSFLDTCSSLNFTAPIGPDGKPVSIPKKHSTTSSKLVLDVTTVTKPIFTKPTCVASHNTTTTTTNSTIAWSTAFTNSTSVIATSATFTHIPDFLNTTSSPFFPTNISSTSTVGLNSSSTTLSPILTTITRVIVVTRTLPPTKTTATTSNGNQASYTDRSHPVKRQEGDLVKRFYKAISREELNHDSDKAELLQAIDAYLSEGELVTIELVDKQVSVDTSSLTSEISLEQLTSAFSFNEDISSFSSSVSTTTDNMLSSPLTGSFIATTTIATIDTALSTNIASVSPSLNDMSGTTGNSTLVQSTFTATSTTTLSSSSSSSDTGAQATSGSGSIISANSTATVTRTASLTSTKSGMSDTITVTSTSTRRTSSSEPNPDTTISVTTSVTGSTVTGGTSAAATTTTTSGESNSASFLGFDMTWLFSVVIIPGFVILM